VIERLLSTDTLDLIQRGLDASALSHSVIANNIANVDTPGFKRSEVVFEEQLKNALALRDGAPQQLALATTDPRHIAMDAVPDLDTIRPEVVTDVTSSLRNDGNNVDIDNEVSLLAQNTVRYQTLASITQHQFAQILDAITDNAK
jgi:flagellar basal-body rod protein FlgB